MNIKVDIISGFLGSGKTTLIKKLLNEELSSEKVVIIENEFGQVGIDGGFLKNTGIQIKEINSGCICCSLAGDFDAALKEILKKYQPDRIIVEPSGVGKLSDIITSCNKAVAPSDGKINICTAVVDPIKYKMYMKNFSEFFKNQIECAKTIILSRTQKLEEEKLETVVKDIKSHNRTAPIITTPWDELTADTILTVAEQNTSHSLANQMQHEYGNHECHEHHHAKDFFENWGLETPRMFSEKGIEKTLKILSDSDSYGTVLRAKGIVPIGEKSWVQFNFVPQEFEIKPSDPDYTGRLCVIGVNLNKEKLAELFHG